MSTEKDRSQRSRSVLSRMGAVKLNYGCKKLPLDFFGPSLSSSPKKMANSPLNADLLAEWYQRDQSREKPKCQFPRMTQVRPIQIENRFCKHVGVSPCRPTHTQKIYTHEQTQETINRRLTGLLKSGVKNDRKVLEQPRVHRLFGNMSPAKERVGTGESRVKIIRYVHSEGKSRRSHNNLSKDNKSVFRVRQNRRSLRQLSQLRGSLKEVPQRYMRQEQRQSQGVLLGFDGMVTFSSGFK